MVVSFPCSFPSSHSLGCSPLHGQAGLLGPVRLWDDDVGVLQEGPGTEAVVVDRLGVGLQVALHVLWVKGEVRAKHGGESG